MEHENNNSGVYIRIPIERREPQMLVWYGYEVQIENHPETAGEDAYHITGTLYSLTKLIAKPGKPGPQWNTMEITLDGLRTMIVVNGVNVTDYKEGDPAPPRKFDYEPSGGRRPEFGWFGIQNDSSKSVVYFREIALKPLAAEAHSNKKEKVFGRDQRGARYFPRFSRLLRKIQHHHHFNPKGGWASYA